MNRIKLLSQIVKTITSLLQIPHQCSQKQTPGKVSSSHIPDPFPFLQKMVLVQVKCFNTIKFQGEK